MITIPTTSTAKCVPSTKIGVDGDLLVIEKDGTEHYRVTELATRWNGRAFQLVKLSTGEVHHTFIATTRTQDHCDCRGFERYSYCRHTDVLRAVCFATGDVDAHGRARS
jgi:hypothetical protein